ncbi:tRNA lysidine(34) synthetase TilS [Sphingobium phenoxybenzoativorans]|uniref:tRNA lysidine(34) synthetase TilS n=1 Tax=Sphingobium phenoxybenzoativorans TaxID=1592790 RepID=UPI000872E3A3|nr:tRNA lysidine(34) synthetase TilS [Sphingobium phenoxybenzoativorans]
MRNAAPDAAAGRFRDEVEGLSSTAADARYGIAVSGGPDSMALLLLAARAFPGRVEAATVDHGLRAASREEASMVADWCGAQGIPHSILTPDVPITGSLQASARAARYALLDRWRVDRRIDWLMTAHHADDQLETILMRLNRGAGVAGLAGVRRRNGAVLRPLLGWRKAELIALAHDAGLPFVEDPSNSDARFDRANMRRHLAGADWLDPVAAAKSAAALAESEEALNWMVSELAARHIVKDGDAIILQSTDFPREVQRRLVLRMVAEAGGMAQPPRGDTLDDALARLEQGGKASLGDWLLSGGSRWSLRPAPPRRGGSVAMDDE